MGRDLTNLNIKDTYEGLVQISGSQLTDGTGSLIPSLDITASTATSASHAVYADTAGGATDVNALYTASISDDTIAFLKGGGSTFDIVVNNVNNAVSASYATTADTATSASYATTASFAINSTPNTLDEVLTAGSSSAIQPRLTNGIKTGTTRTLTETLLSSGGAGVDFSIVAGGSSASTLTLNNAGGGSFITLNHTSITSSATTKFEEDIIVENGIKVSSSLAPTIEIQSIDGTYDSSLNFQRGTTYEGYVASTTESLELAGLGGRNVRVSGSDFVVDNALTASGLHYPTTDGSSGDVMTTDGLGNITFQPSTGFPSGLISGSGYDSLISANYTTTDAIAAGTESIAIGQAAIAQGDNSIVIGANSQVTGSSSFNTIVIGAFADSRENSTNNVIIGYGAYMNEANRDNSVIIGAQSHGYQEGVAVGANTFGTYKAVAVGRNANASSNYSTAVGADSQTLGDETIALGNSAYASALGGTAVGGTAQASGDYGLALGYNAVAGYPQSVAIGTTMTTAAEGDIVVGAGLQQVWTYSSGSNLTTLKGTLAIDGISDVSASIAAATGSTPTLQEVLTTGDSASYSNVVLYNDLQGDVNETNNTSSIIVSAQVSESLSFPINENYGILVGGTKADYPIFYTSQISGSRNTLVWGMNQPGDYSGLINLQNVSESVFLASQNVEAGSGFGYSGETHNVAVIASSGHIKGGVPLGGLYSTYLSYIYGSSNPRSNSAIFGGRSHTLNQSYNSQIFGGQNNSIPNAFVDNNQILGGTTNTINGGGNNGLALGIQNTIHNGSYNHIVGGSSNQLTAGGGHGNIFGSYASTINVNSSFPKVNIWGGDSSTIQNRVAVSTIIGASSATINANTGATSNDWNYNFIGGGFSNGITNTNNTDVYVQKSTIVGGNGNYITTKGGSVLHGSVVGGQEHSVEPTTGTLISPTIVGGRAGKIIRGDYSTIIGGNTNTINTSRNQGTIINGNNNSITSGAGCGIVGGFLNTLSGYDYCFMGGGSSNSISGTASNRSSIIGGTGNTISNKSDSFILGGSSNSVSHNRSGVLGGTGLTTSKDDEIVVKHLSIKGVVKGNVGTLTDAGGTTTMDCSTANFFTFTLPSGGATTQLNATNIQVGQTINVRITQDATTPATLNFGTMFKFENATPFVVSTGTSAVDVMTFVSFDGTTLQATGLKNFG